MGKEGLHQPQEVLGFNPHTGKPVRISPKDFGYTNGSELSSSIEWEPFFLSEAEIGNVRTLVANEELYTIGDPVKSSYFLIEGELKLRLLNPTDGKHLEVLNLVYPGELVGYEGFIDSNTRTMVAQAEKVSTVREIDMEDIWRLWTESDLPQSNSANFRLNIINQLLYQRSLIENKRVEAAYGTLRAQVIQYLLRSTMDCNNGIQITQRAIAEELSSHRRTVGTILRGLREYIRTGQQYIIILNKEALESELD